MEVNLGQLLEDEESTESDCYCDWYDAFKSPPRVLSAKNINQREIRNKLNLHSIASHRDQKINDQYFKASPFLLRWIHGYNAKLPVLNMNDGTNTLVFYAAGNCGVLYNWSNNTMRILQGHKNPVKSIAMDATAKWLVTAGSGADNVVTVWNSETVFPQKTFFAPHGNVKVSKVAISPDAKYLLTLGYSEWATLSWWIWTSGADVPQASTTVNIFREGVLQMEFNPINTKQFCLLTKNDIWVGEAGKIFVMERGVLKETDSWELTVMVPPRKDPADYGRLKCFTYVKNTAQILIGTSRGAILIYGLWINYRSDAGAAGGSSSLKDLRYVKGLRLQTNRINVITSIDNVIVTGDSRGSIRFYDEQLKLMYWVHGFTPDGVRSLSFNVEPRQYRVFDNPACQKEWKRPLECDCFELKETDSTAGFEKYFENMVAGDAAAKVKPFVVRNFTVSTINQGIWFVDFTTETYKVIVDCMTSNATAMTVHPEKQTVCLGYMSGYLELYDFVTRRLKVRLDLRDLFKVVTPPCPDSASDFSYKVSIPALVVTCLLYSPSGLHLACGLNTGEVLFLDPVTIQVLPNKKCLDTTHAIRKFSYSPDSTLLAYADAGKTVGVYKYECETLSWSFIGKYRSHYKDICSVFFVPIKHDSGTYILLSIGKDRIMNEYDIGDSGANEELKIVSLDRIDQTAVPLAAIPWPANMDLDPERHRTDIPLILLANDEYKYKLLNYSTTLTMSTVLGPRYPSPVTDLKLITNLDLDKDINHQYLVFVAKNIIGLQKMPLDGNPWKHVGVLGHPHEILKMSFREDCGLLFSIADKDSCMFQWAANYQAVETSYAESGPDLDPYYCLIDGGRPGWLFQEVRDLFYYIQILCQGTFSPAMRIVKDVIPIDSLPDLMRALGFFPSEYEVENLLTEAKYKVYQYTPSAEIDFEEFVKLYINHRPAFGETLTKIRQAFKLFANFDDEKYLLPREDFVDLLSQYGEQFSKELSWYLLSILHGHSFEERAEMNKEDFDFLPDEIEFGDFMYTIIGIGEWDFMSQHSDHSDHMLDSAIASTGSMSSATE